MKYEASEPDSFHRTLDAAMAKARLVSTRDALAKALREDVMQHIPEPFESMPDQRKAYWLGRADALLTSGAVIDVATLADNEDLVRDVAFQYAEGEATYAASTVRYVLRALAAALSAREAQR